jgi:hypothetical protein
MCGPRLSWAGDVGQTVTGMSCMCCCVGDGAWCAWRSGMLMRPCMLSCHGGGHAFGRMRARAYMHVLRCG